MQWIIDNQATILAIWLLAEQVIASVPALKSNSTIQLVCNIIDSVVNAIKKNSAQTEVAK